MQNIGEITDRELVWRKPRSLKEEYELHAGDDVAATLHWPRSYGSLAEAAAEGGSWTFKRSGFWRVRATIRTAGSDADIAVFDPRWTGDGALTFATGATYRWERAHFWGSRYEWRNTENEPLVRFATKAGLLRTEAAVELEPAARALPELQLLTLFGWYLLVMGIRDSSAAGAGAAAAGAAASSS
ncbi:MAG: hypothetical protein WKH64_09180 [Chloroflexia bacterium]